MMGQAVGQRSTLTMNHGRYYFDTTVPYSAQQNSTGNGTTYVPNLNVFAANQAYYFYVLYFTLQSGHHAFSSGWFTHRR